MKVSPLQSNFSGGEFSPLFSGRVDADRYKTGLAVCENFVPTIQGGLTRRPGTKYVHHTKDHGEARLEEFEFSTTQAYILEFGNLYIRFYKDNGVITDTAKNITGATAANPVVITSNAHGFSNGDRVYITSVGGMVELNNREFTCANVTANTFELSGVNGTGYTAYASGGTASEIYEIVSPYPTAVLFELKFVQSADVLYIVHPSYAPRKLSRTGHTSWTMTTIDFLYGPFLSENTTAVTMQSSSTTGATTITASSATFVSTDVGRLIQLRISGFVGSVKLTGYTSSTVMTGTVQESADFSVIGAAATTTTRWKLGVWSETTGYPDAVVFHEDRLFFAGSSGSPQRFDGSRTGDYENFASTDKQGTTTDSNALAFTLSSNDVNRVRWMTSDEKGLLIGTVGGEWAVSPSTQSEALSPTNVNARRATSFGSANIQAVQGGKATLYVQRAGRKVRELTYFFDQDGFRSNDITILSEHITSPGITQIAYQKEPHSILWMVRDDGQLVGCTYDRDLDNLRVGWHRHIIGGVSDAASSDAIVESIAVIPAPDNTREEAWFIVKRRINGATVRQIEYMSKFFDDDTDQQDAFFVDSGVTYDNPVTISGATAANPVVVTANAHGFSNGDVVVIRDVKGMTELNGESYIVANAAANTFELNTLASAAVDGSAYSVYVSGGEVRKYVTTISGYNHLIGQSVSILADGAVLPAATISSAGVLTLSQRAATVQVGLGYNSDAQLMRLENGAADGTALGKKRRIIDVGFLLHRSLGLKFGTNFDELNTIVFRSSTDLMTRAPALFTGVQKETVGMGFDTEQQICFRQYQPLPTTVLAVLPHMKTEDR